MADGQLSVWAAQELHPDKNILPVSYSIAECRDGTGSGAQLSISIDDDNIIVAQDLDGGCREIKSVVSLNDYLGVTMALAVAKDKYGEPDRPAMMVLLEHEDPSRTVPLFVSWESGDIVEEWQSWARTLDLPARVRGTNGISHQPLGKVCGVDFSPSSKRTLAHRTDARHGQRVKSARRANIGIEAKRAGLSNREIVARH